MTPSKPTRPEITTKPDVHLNVSARSTADRETPNSIGQSALRGGHLDQHVRSERQQNGLHWRDWMASRRFAPESGKCPCQPNAVATKAFASTF